VPTKGTPHRPIRIDDVTWAKAQAKAARLGTSASAKARELLTAWADDEDEPTSGC
jgi:plasmid stability protein